MVGSGVVTLEEMYPLVMGSNIGGSFSGVLAALSADSSRFEKYDYHWHSTSRDQKMILKKKLRLLTQFILID